MAETTIKIEGMSCRHCVMRVKKAIDALAGVSASNVAVGNATVTYDEARLRKEDIEAAVVNAGYKVVSS
ncbi:MAG: heavy-metal-associated domain-containing protein [Nitrospirae bacterium]|nr:heavy-metal-associated domain-containing protein [Nitrospirota bacterium]